MAKPSEPTVPKEESLCRLGYCVTKDSHYEGGNLTVWEKLENGICPICDGALERKYRRGVRQHRES